MKHLLTVLTLVFLSNAFAQDIILDGTAGVQMANTCSGNFFDTGGDGSPSDITAFYGNIEDDTITICPDQPGKLLRFYVVDYRIQQNDQLFVFDGNSTSANLLGVYSQTGLGYDLKQNDTIQATTSNTTGCMTFVFKSNGDSKVDQGWNFRIECYNPCQEVIATGTFNGLTPSQRNAPIKICRNDIVNFAGFGIYPDMNTPNQIYPQDNASSNFAWIITPGNGISNSGAAGGAGGTYQVLTDSSTAFYQFADSGIFHVKLEITDGNPVPPFKKECKNTNYLDQIVWVSGPPVFDPVSNPNFGTRPLQDTICLGDVDTLVAEIVPFQHIEQCNPSAGSLEFVPDGQDDGSGLTYESKSEVKCYPIDVTVPGSGIINNPDDILSICMDLEHSSVGDLEMTLTCPSGQSIRLLIPNLTDHANLGEPIDIPGSKSQGIVYNYCFDRIATSTISAVSVTLNTVQSVPAGNYLPIDDFTNFVGCEINGNWVLTVKDGVINDNGFAGNWQMVLDPAIQPTFGNSFTNTYVDSTWSEEPTNPPGGSIISSLAQSDTLLVQPKTIGTYCYNLELLDDFGCTYDTTVCLVVLKRDTADFQFSKPTYCVNEPAQMPTYINNGKAGTFDVSPLTGLTVNTSTGGFNPSGATPGTYVITNTVYNQQGKCPDVHSFTVTIVDTVKPNITANGTYCQLDTAALLNPGSFASWEWLFAGNPSGVVNDTALVTNANNPFSVRAVDANGCITFSDALNTNPLSNTTLRDTIRLCAGDSALINGQFRHIAGPYSRQSGVGVCDTVFITELIYYPVVTIGPDAAICFGNSANLTASGVDGPANFTWSNNFVGTSQTVNPVTNTEFSVIAVDVHGCVTMDTMMVTVDPVLDGTVTYSSTTFCPGSPNVLPTTIATAGGVFSSSPAGFVDPVTGEVFVSTMASGTYTISYNLQPFSACNIATNLNFVITNSFDGNLFYSPATLCTNGGTAAPVFTGTGAGVMTVIPATGLIMNANTGVIDLSGSTAGTYTITNSPAAGCPGTPGVTNITIVDPTPISASASPVVICQNQPSQLSVAPSTLVSYSWDNGGGSGSTVTVFPQSSTTYTVTAVDVNGCSSTTAATVFVNALPILSITPPVAQACAGDDVTLTGTLVNKGAFNPADMIAFSWSPTTNMSNPSQTTAAVIGSTTSVYSGTTSTVFTLSATNTATGCVSNPVSVSITINPLPTMSATAAPQNTVCLGDQVTINGTGTLIQTIQWNNGIQNNTAFTPPLGTTTYTGIAFSSDGCQSAPFNVTINVNPLPNITITGNTNPLCDGALPETLTASGATSYVWSTTETGPTIVVNPVVGMNAITVVGTDANGCSNVSAGFNFNVFANDVVADIVPDNVIVYPGTTVNFGNGSTGADNFVWEFGNGDPNVTIGTTATQTAIYQDTLNSPYTVVLLATNTTNGCFKYDTVIIAVIPNPAPIIYIPNIFTPNNDNTNDGWTIDVTNDMGKEMYIEVFNRWGNRLKEIKDFKDTWDGTDKGDPASEGVYFFKYRLVGYDGKEYTGHGNITLIRNK